MAWRPPPRSLVFSTGMLETPIWPLGASTVRPNTDLIPGSSHMGARRRASEFSNWVKRARFLPSLSS
jgi:hypothetical protein